MQHPDRLVAFFALLHARLHAYDPEAAALIGDVADEAQEVNLTTMPSVSEADLLGAATDEDVAAHVEYHMTAYNLTGSHANARRAVSQLSDEHVEDVANAVAERVAAAEATR